ncbi:hypothetical protein [Nonomuraea sp. NEAU-A123]|uniref:hypothetical protein n=1 Tax=Nonomuraea sp. NEAU-A123 TaxID=2839649 RepID=UPI001BE44BF1|nr:hypothetical protein [Nonomuraea sp. NEAU-A123]MBT2234728.1 hypothetical protein [Nonomuraea sp. NEAU-A123]
MTTETDTSLSDETAQFLAAQLQESWGGRRQVMWKPRGPRPTSCRRTPRTTMLLASEIDAEVDKWAIPIAEELQRRAGGWWLVMWSLGNRCFVAIYLGFWQEGGLVVEAEAPDTLWARMAPHIPIEVLLRAPGMPGWAARPTPVADTLTAA